MGLIAQELAVVQGDGEFDQVGVAVDLLDHWGKVDGEHPLPLDVIAGFHTGEGPGRKVVLGNGDRLVYGELRLAGLAVLKIGEDLAALPGDLHVA